MGRWFERRDTAVLETILDEHFHTISRWRGAKAGADEANAMDDVLTAFRVDSGNTICSVKLPADTPAV